METTIAARTTSKRSAAGFTLLEMVVVLLVVTIVIGGAFGMMAVSADERALSRSKTEIEVLAKRARSISTLQQRPYALEFFDQSARMMPLAEAAVDPERREEAILYMESDEATAEMFGGRSRFPAVRATWTVDEDIRLFVRRWASETWLPADSKSRHVWRFDPDGFCEPIGVRLELGRSWIELEFNPLTGGVRDYASEIY